MLSTKNLLSVVLLSLIFAGCAIREVDYRYSTYKYKQHGTQSDYKYIHPKNEAIKDSLAMHRATANSYTVLGKTYQPNIVKSGTTLTGIASWYGPTFHEKLTSNGEIYNMYAFTAAHKTLPMNTMVKVVNKENGKSVIVRINDRGPFVDGRIIDLSNVAARAIDMVKKGTAPVELEVLSLSANALSQYNGDGLPQNGGYVAQNEPRESLINKKSSGEIFVQLGAFSQIDGAKSIAEGFVSALYTAKVEKFETQNGVLYKVLVDGFKNENEARDFIESSDRDGLHIVRQ